MGVFEKDPGSGKWRFIRNSSAEDDDGASTNGWLNAKDSSIMWHTVSMVADFVSNISFLLDPAAWSGASAPVFTLLCGMEYGSMCSPCFVLYSAMWHGVREHVLAVLASVG